MTVEAQRIVYYEHVKPYGYGWFINDDCNGVQMPPWKDCYKVAVKHGMRPGRMNICARYDNAFYLQCALSDDKAEMVALDLATMLLPKEDPPLKTVWG